VACFTQQAVTAIGLAFHGTENLCLEHQLFPCFP
jgi:hypothetical protein